jgi:ABC-type branched-subunit amino acid transport system substrate-binding protein
VFLGLPPLPAAIVSQHLRAQQPQVELLVYPWALSQQDFLASGGQAVEGALGLSRVPPIPETPRHISYVQSYEKRFNHRSTRADAMAYEAMQILLWAMQQTNDRKQYKSLILQKGTFDGLADPIFLDAFGDSERSFYIVRVRDRRLVNEGKL